MNLNLAQKVSVLIITLNEAVNLRELLVDLDFADEVIIVDSYSSDNTKLVAQSFSNVKFLQNKFENYSFQRNFAISKAKNDWILFLDADERLSSELKKEIIDTLKSDISNTAFLFPRKFMFKNTVLRYSGWQTDKIFRLFNKNFAKYKPEKLVHEKLEVVGNTATFKNHLIHYSYTDYNSYKKKMIAYGKLKAKEKYAKKLNPSFLLTVFHPVYSFLYNYIVRLGILDGKKGILICYLNSYSIYIRYQELRKLWKNNILISRRNI